MAQNTVTLLFAGQGAQTVGMGQDLVEKYPVAAKLMEQADEILGFSLSEVMFKGPMSELTRTSRCQPALYVHGLMCLAVLRELVPDIEVVGAAGLSLGEFTAHAAAGTFDFETGLRLVAKRGNFMEEATDATEGTMAAMIGGDDDKVSELATLCNIDVANYNAPGQVVVSGSKEGVSQAIEKAEEYGIRIAKELEVAGAYHSRQMVPAQDKLSPELATTEILTPQVPVICNVHADYVSTPNEIRATLAGQVSGSVRWNESVSKFIADGQSNFLELGPGGVLTGLMRRIDRKATIAKAFDVETLEKVADALNDTEEAAAA